MARRLTLSLIAAAIGLCIAAALGEVAVRVIAAVRPAFATGLRAFDPMGIQIEPHGTLGYRQRPNATFHYANGTQATSNAMGYRGPAVSVEPPPGTIRILLFGGSTSHGWAVPDDQTIDAHMRTLLRERFPAQHFEVVNLAFDGYDSYQDLQRLISDGLRLHPSIVILNTGINDVRNAWFPGLTEADPRTLIWEDELRRLRAEQQQGGPSLWTRIKHYSFLSRTPGYVRGQLQRRRSMAARLTAPVATAPAATAPSAAAVKQNSSRTESVRGKPPYPEAAELFDRHVREMTKLALAQGASVLLSTPPSALRSLPDTARSEQSYWVGNAKITQEYRDELSRRMIAIAAEESAAGHGVRYVAAAVPIVSPSLFLDDCHLTGPGNRFLAGAFVDAIQPLLSPRKGSD